MIKGAEKKISPQQYMNLVFSYNEEQGKQLLIDREKEKRGEQITAADNGTPRNFTTELDMELYDWLAARCIFEAANSSAQSSMFFKALYKVCATGDDARPAFEAVVGQDTYSLVDAGIIKLENIPPDIKAIYDAYVSTITPAPEK